MARSYSIEVVGPNGVATLATTTLVIPAFTAATTNTVALGVPNSTVRATVKMKQ